jgi:hypothetical protein
MCQESYDVRDILQLFKKKRDIPRTQLTIIFNISWNIILHKNKKIDEIIIE